MMLRKWTAEVMMPYTVPDEDKDLLSCGVVIDGTDYVRFPARCGACGKLLTPTLAPHLREREMCKACDRRAFERERDAERRAAIAKQVLRDQEERRHLAKLVGEATTKFRHGILVGAVVRAELDTGTYARGMMWAIVLEKPIHGINILHAHIGHADPFAPETIDDVVRRCNAFEPPTNARR